MILLRPRYDIAVVIPTSNDDARLQLALEGYAAQTDPNFELHVVNDGGSDLTAELVDRFRRRLSIHYHYLAGQGRYRPASARNLGIDRCDADRIILSDCDVIPCPIAVQEHRRYANSRCYVLGMRRRLQRHIVERILLPRMRSSVLRLDDIPRYPWLGDHRLIEPAFRPMFRALLDDRAPDAADRVRFCKYFDYAPDQMPGELWKAWFCWSFNVSFSGKYRFNPGFDDNYGHEDLEFGLRLIADGNRVVVNQKIVAYHLDHLPRADDDSKQRGLFQNTLREIIAGMRR